MAQKTAVIVGAGPAGLTAAYEFVTKTDIKPIIFEMTNDIGGISKTVNYKGNRMDIGGHRFFSKSDRVMNWWQNILPIQTAPTQEDLIVDLTYQQKKKSILLSKENPNTHDPDKVMLVRNRMSRIFFLRKFFDYPVTLNLNTISNLGIIRIIKIMLSYVRIRIFPIRQEKSLEDFFINRFGKELYLTFFKDYTEKVWGVSCTQIKPEWGAQRIKGLSVTKTIMHAIKSILKKEKSIEQKNVETSLIEKFLYPKFGPGQMWEEVARVVTEKGAELHKSKSIVGIKYNGTKIDHVEVKDLNSGEIHIQKADYFFSTMPVKDLILGMGSQVPKEVSRVANGLMYRDFITVGLLLKKLKIKNTSNKAEHSNICPDNWIYIQERDVKIGRLQVFNNWSPYLVKDPNTVWLGLEYFCNVGDELWNKQDSEFLKFAVEELTKIDIIEKDAVLDGVVVRMPKTYPAYFGTYDEFQVIRNFTDKLENLFLVGRNGMHRYNNQDHSMLTAMVAVENIMKGVTSKENIWAVNVEQEYHEEKK